MSKTLYEEIIEIMGKKVQQNIVDQINEQASKYFSLVVDSSPPVAHVDQLAIVVRYCRKGHILPTFKFYSNS